MHPLWQIEGPSLLWIQVNLRQDWLTPIMQVITRFGDGGIFWIGFCILLLCIPKSRRTGIAASLSLALNGLVTNACLKNIIGRVKMIYTVERTNGYIDSAVHIKLCHILIQI